MSEQQERVSRWTKLVSDLTSVLTDEGIVDLFVYTKTQNWTLEDLERQVAQLIDGTFT